MVLASHDRGLRKLAALKVLPSSCARPYDFSTVVPILFFDVRGSYYEFVPTFSDFCCHFRILGLMVVYMISEVDLCERGPFRRTFRDSSSSIS